MCILYSFFECNKSIALFEKSEYETNLRRYYSIYSVQMMRNPFSPIIEENVRLFYSPNSCEPSLMLRIIIHIILRAPSIRSNLPFVWWPPSVRIIQPGHPLHIQVAVISCECGRNSFTFAMSSRLHCIHQDNSSVCVYHFNWIDPSSKLPGKFGRLSRAKFRL